MRPQYDRSDENGIAQRIVSIAAGEKSSFAVTADGVLYSWGMGDAARGVSPPNVESLTAVFTGNLSGTYTLSVGAGPQHTVVTTSSGKTYAWGSNNFGQLGIGCDALNGAYPPTQVIPYLPVPPATSPVDDKLTGTLTFWRTVDDTTASGATEIMSLPPPAPPSAPTPTVTVASSATPCQVACTLEPGCGGFSLPKNSNACTFYKRPEKGWIAQVPDNGKKLYLLERVPRGGATVAAAGGKADSGFSLLASGLSQLARCAAGANQLECGGPEQGVCVAGQCQCKPGWIGDACLASACIPACTLGRGTCEGATLTCTCESGWEGVEAAAPLPALLT